MSEKLAGIKKVGGGSGGSGFKTCTIVGTLSDTTYLQRGNESATSFSNLYGASGRSTVTIVINLEDGTYTISGNSTGATTNYSASVTNYPWFRGTSSVSFTISSITFS